MANTLLEDALTMEEIPVSGYEKVIKITEKSSGLKAIICLHDSTLGPALGGTRIYPYATFEAALNDVKRLAKGMTYKSALAECSWGGGKSVIIADAKQKTEQLLHAFGAAVTRLKGTYICAEDLGCTPQDISTIAQTTPYVVGIMHEKSSGDPSPFTAWGVYRGIQSVIQQIFKTDSVEGKTIAIQGVGAVGERLAEILFWQGAKLILCDMDKNKVARLAKLYGAQVVRPDEIYSAACDVFAPCALGGILNPDTIPTMRCKAVAGSANNQLLRDQDADALRERGILYAPDFIINAGGLINVSLETREMGYHPLAARNQVNKLYDQLMLIYDISQKNRCSTHAAAICLGDYRLKYGIGKRVEPVYMHHANVCY